MAPVGGCLEHQDGQTTTAAHEIFQPRPIEGETYLLAENEVNLEPMVRELVLLAMPVAPLCSEDCAGPDPDRFPTEVEKDPEPDAEPAIDPRWGALSELSFEE